MTAQTPEILIIDRRPRLMLCTPLDNFCAQVPWKPVSYSSSTANYRGYVGRWEIIGGRLYLTGVVCQDWIIPPQMAGKLAPDPDPFDRQDEGSKTLRLSDIFPEEAPLVPATWVTGLLTVVTGGCLVHVHAGFGSLYASYRIVNVVQGRVGQVRDLSARDWARRCERYLPDDWFEEEPEDDAAEDEVAPDWRNQTDPSLRRFYYRRAQIEDLCHPCGTATDARPWPLWRDQRRVARRWLLRGERSRSSARGRR